MALTQTHSFKVADSLYLVKCTTNKAGSEKQQPKVVDVPTNHFLVIDCSGSMYGELPKIREQLKKKLPKLLKEKDTVSIIWFSGKGEFGTLLEAEPVATLADLNQVNAAIDRWLKPVGLTGFKEPVEEAAKVVERVKKKHPGSTASLFFLSDGCDNQWGRPDLLKTVEKAADGFAAATFVEYGYYADRPLLTQMAEKCGGSLIFAEDFDRYQPAFEAVMQKKVSGVKRIEHPVEGDPVGGFVYALVDDDLVTYSVEGGKATIPEDLAELAYLSHRAVGVPEADLETLSKSQKGRALDLAYAAVSLFAVRMMPDVVYPLLKALGDVKLIVKFATCFGKQKYSEFMELAKEAAFGKGRFEDGWDPNKVPRDDAFTVLDLLRILAEDDENAILMEHPQFKYSRIGRGRVDSSENLTVDELDEIKKLTEKIAGERDPKKIKEHNDRIAAITDSKKPALKFVEDPAPNGYPISSLTFNEDRPNVSVLVRKTGTVDVSDRLPDNLKGRLDTVKTFIWRNYAIIKDGLVNVDLLPVRISPATLKKIRDAGFPLTAVHTADQDVKTSLENVKNVIDGKSAPLVVDLKSLPVINRKMIKATSAKDFFTAQFELTKWQAAQKVYNAYVKELLPSNKAQGLASVHGDEAAAWLKDQGITDGGFSPKTTVAASQDFYMGKELKCSLKGYAKLPSLSELKAMMVKGKLNPPGALMEPTAKEVEAFLASAIYQKAAQKEKVLEAWLDGQAKDAKGKTRSLIYSIAQTTFCLIVGQVWFREFSSLDENMMILKTDDDKDIECKAEMREIQIKI